MYYFYFLLSALTYMHARIRIRTCRGHDEGEKKEKGEGWRLWTIHYLKWKEKSFFSKIIV